MSLKERIRFLLDDMSSIEGKFTSAFLISMNFIFVILYIFETYQLPDFAAYVIWVAEIVITVIFTLEYFARLYSSEKGLIRKLTEPLMIIDLIAILPVYLVLIGPGTALSAGFLKVFRVFRVFRFLRIAESRKFIWGKVSDTDLEIIKFITIIFSVFFVTSGFFYEVEVTENPGVETLRDSLYYMVVTLTTVGFGDITPVTSAGRWVTIFSIMAAIIVIPWQASKIVKTWSHKDKKEVKCSNCGLKYHDPDASHCKACGEVIEQEHDPRDPNYL
jgi:voltage-gated potassium channel